jgi:catechol-2,3-dioxygenase
VSTESAPPVARVAAVSLDCADPGVLATFYLSLLGGEPLWRNDGSAGIRVPGLVLVLQRVADYQPPVWPGSALVHLDLTPASSLADTVTAAVQAGATLASFQPDPRWRVLLDPAGHPFCLTTVTPT